MKILALDTSSQAASCAVIEDNKLIAENFLNNALTHSQTIMPMVEFTLKNAGFSLNDIDLLATNTGPGSFTGLRIGISCIKGMSYAMDIPCAAISTLHSLSFNIIYHNGYIVPCMDARREQIYTAIFYCNNANLKRISKDCAVPIQEYKKELKKVDKPIILVGDGAEKTYNILCEDIKNIAVAPNNLLHQRAASTAAIAAKISTGEYIAANELNPKYLRLPAAERERIEKIKK